MAKRRKRIHPGGPDEPISREARSDPVRPRLAAEPADLDRDEDAGIVAAESRPAGPIAASHPSPIESDVSPETTPTGPIHRPVLLDEVLQWLRPREGAVLVDGTVGAGGHAAALARHVGTSGRVIGLDRDPAMLALAKQATRGLPVTLVHAPYSQTGEVLDDLGIDRIDGLLLDLGLSSDQLAWAHRGFSFAQEGPLDMRFDPEGDLTAAEIVNTWPADDLADLFFKYGEERFSRRIARRIVEARRERPIQTTSQLAELVRRSLPGPRGKIDPATRVFQALRIGVNRELDHLDAALAHLADWLRPGGRAAIISFHSLEDRRVKQAFRDNPRLIVLTKKPLTASDEEIQRNPRARSAKLRVAERC
ncbi:MAG: 16S rRNA (cytosine(1402)-N(4))-methyltransferase RsmH [Isosphaeraceae bacterium]|nr:16S rRNA (cytosine(1402)-N(4))-methyltransferase RsmH [Isosphaeraceae bacterium]